MKEAKIKSQQKRNAKEFKIKSVELRNKINVLIDDYNYTMYIFGNTNKKVRKIYYDIEEGGEYLMEFNKSDTNIIDKIIRDELNRQSRFFFENPSSLDYFPTKISSATDERIKIRIINEMTTFSDKDNNYIGF